MLNQSKNILIQSYLHESGLWYLSLSLAKELKHQGHHVKFIPKAKYIKQGVRYQKYYWNQVKSEFDHLPLEVNSDILQLNSYIKKFQIDTIISFETLMEDAYWISKLNSKVYLVDVPMLEWVTPSILESGKYQCFDEIWALTDLTYQTFIKANQNQVKKIRWDFVDRTLFKNDPNPWSSVFVYFHQASLNPDHSTKNTDKVIQAFNLLSYPDIELIISGNVNSELQHLIQANQKIKTFNRLLSRQEVANVYSNTNCVVMPSSKEGLGMTLFEAAACGCQIITTDASPMNEHPTPYLCPVTSFKKDRSLVPSAEVTIESIYQQMKKVYEDYQ